MNILPAIDIKSGKCVRLWQGSFNRVDIYGDDPVEMALKWEKEGADMLHIVDLDAAVTGKPVNRDYITGILKAVHVPVQIGGGVRDRTMVEYYIEHGARSIVITTFAYEHPEEVIKIAKHYPGKISIGVDVLSGAVAIKGWTQTGNVSSYDFIKKFSDAPVYAFIVTDIYKDGTLSGIEPERIKKALDGVSEPVIISGGVSNIDDIRTIKHLRNKNITGVIIGRALYTGAIKLIDAMKAVE
ncbi:MAG: 1-(5-phosphoribosyl)-5-[(5-phosphoribosylamino)methylideneamino]imidazole-4-carboxamide isomerase [Deltaproteobacteria bacterium]|nr:1-(5-phosphoribosyl)-5-[(5-phosphoribosylamino)methylideneamino]imidazole-4-carboxamide isomerase [Deltaproteobacteria bacterium]